MRHRCIISFLLFLLSASFFACASPVDISATNELSKHGAGSNDDAVLELMSHLKVKVDGIISQIDALSSHGGDPSALLAEIKADVNTAVDALLALDPDKSGTHTNKKHQIGVILVDIIVSLVVALGKFPITQVYLALTATVDIFLKKLLLALNAAIVGIVDIAAVLLTHVDIFAELKLVLTLIAFGLSNLLQRV